jgi:clan AA aspartic protease (TIGR02281 family)
VSDPKPEAPTFLLSAVAAEPGPDAPGSDPAVAGDALFAKGDFAGALAAYLRALQAQPNDLGANLGAARLELFCNELDAAMEHAHATLAIDPSNAGAAHVVEEITRSLAASHNDRVENLNGHVDVPFLQTDPLPQVAVTVNGHRARLLLDAGAPGLDLSENFAATAGVTATAVGKGVFAGGRSAQIRMGGKIDALAIGTITAHDVPAGVSPVGPNVDGVLGMNFLDHFLATIDYVHGRLILRPKSASDAFGRTAADTGERILPPHRAFV